MLQKPTIHAYFEQKTMMRYDSHLPAGSHCENHTTGLYSVGYANEMQMEQGKTSEVMEQSP